MGNCSSNDGQVTTPTPKSVRVAKDVIIHELGSPLPRDSVKGILLKDGGNKLRTLSRVSWRDIGALAGAALPESLDGDESTGLSSRVAALGAPDPADVAAALQLLKGSTSGSVGVSDAPAQDSTARAADGVLLSLAVGASALSQRAAAARAELKTIDMSSGMSRDAARQVASKLEGVAAAAVEAGKQREALSLCLHAHSLTADAEGPDSPQAAHCLVRVARVLMLMGRLPHAEMIAKHAAQQTAKGFGLEHRAPAEALMLVGEVLGVEGKFEEAKNHLSVALELYICAVGRSSAETADIYMRLGELHRQRLLYDEAARLFRQALNTRKRVLGPRCPETAACMEALAGVMYDSRQYLQAEQLYGQLLQLHLDMNGGGHSAGGLAAMGRLAAVQAADGRDREAETTLKRAQAAAVKLYGTEHPATHGVNLELARLLMRRRDAPAGEVHLRAAEQLLRGCLRHAARPTPGGGKAVGAKAPPSVAAYQQQQEEGAAGVAAEAQVLLAELVSRKGRHEEAERLLTQVVGGGRDGAGGGHGAGLWGGVGLGGTRGLVWV
ncbi:hypothetical protein PLESTB_000029500 [Pleodorina starrii]|uniref:Kinesin light chain n=1 Tax=Pleodorina starrii TaxID=330485 RepID=A0A9W6B8Z5_9CHLO|nr:hypothetical protein PLESTB_000029500 [Pleodorina starrii]